MLITYNLMLANYLGLVNIKGNKIVVCAREGGTNTTSFLAAHFAKRNTKNCGGEKRSGGKARAGKKEGGLGRNPRGLRLSFLKKLATNN